MIWGLVSFVFGALWMLGISSLVHGGPPGQTLVWWTFTIPILWLYSATWRG